MALQLRFVVAVVGLVTGSVATVAQSQFEAGTLTCTGGEGVGLILGSKKSYTCKFKSGDGSVNEGYEATVTRVGLDIGVTGKSTMIWTVLSASAKLAPRALAGNYAGAAADASVGVGGGAKVLVGGSANTITLQPLSVQGQTGVNIAVGVGGMTLR